jgi:hypothetical protein
MKYLFLLRTSVQTPSDPGSPEYAETFAAFKRALDGMREAGVLIDCAPLEPVELATTVRVRDGQTLVTDGPAAELREQVGGYTLVECANLDEALRWAATVPTALTGSVEVRPVLSVPTPA